MQSNRTTRGAAATGWVIAAIMLLPCLSIMALAFGDSGDALLHSAATVLPTYLAQTLLLLFGLGLCTLVIGVPLAWLLTAYEFPGLRILQWLVLLPMAMPTYIIAFTYVDTLNYAGPFQSWLRGAMGWRSPADYVFPEIRSLGGAILVLALVLYPYVYLAARAAFLKQPQNQIDVSRTLGRSTWQTFWSIALPQARPALIVGLSLVLLEALNDIGAMNFFGVQTLALAVYSIWLGQGNLQGAAQLALLLLICIGLILLMERRSRGHEHTLRQTTKSPPLEPMHLNGPKAILAVGIACAPVIFGFMIPVWVLLRFAWRNLDAFSSVAFWSALQNSLLLACVAAILTLVIGSYLALAMRNSANAILRAAIAAATQGYAIPGTVLGLGMIVAFGHFDNWLSPILSNISGQKFGLIFSGSIFALILAYVIRFLAMAYGSVESGLQKISPRIDDVARTLRSNPWRLTRSIHLPLLRPALGAGAIMVFVDSMKELPATLIMRPFDFDTLSTLAFTQASLDRLEASAAPALAIVLVGLLPVLLLARGVHQSG